MKRFENNFSPFLICLEKRKKCFATALKEKKEYLINKTGANSWNLLNVLQSHRNNLQCVFTLCRLKCQESYFLITTTREEEYTKFTFPFALYINLRQSPQK